MSGRFASTKKQKTRVRRPRTGKNGGRTRRHAGQLAVCEASTFVRSTVSSCHQHTRAQGATAKDALLEAKYEAEAEAAAVQPKTIGAGALITDGASAPSTDYHPGGSHTHGGGDDGSSSKPHRSDQGGKQP